MKSYATMLRAMDLPAMQAHKASGTIPDPAESGLSAKKAKRIFQVILSRRERDTVQLCTEVPRGFKVRLTRHTRKRGQVLGEVIVEGMNKWMKEDRNEEAEK